MPYKTFSEYTIFVAIVSLKRAELGKNVSVEIYGLLVTIVFLFFTCY